MVNREEERMVVSGVKDYNPHYPRNEDYSNYKRTRNEQPVYARKCPVCGGRDTKNLMGSRYWCYDCKTNVYIYDSVEEA